MLYERHNEKFVEFKKLKTNKRDISDIIYEYYITNSTSVLTGKKITCEVLMVYFYDPKYRNTELYKPKLIKQNYVLYDENGKEFKRKIVKAHELIFEILKTYYNEKFKLA